MIKEPDCVLQDVSKENINGYFSNIYCHNSILELYEEQKNSLIFLGKYAVYDNWETWSQCSVSCGGGKRNRNRVCLKSDFPPKNDPQTERLISTYGSLAKVPYTTGTLAVGIKFIVSSLISDII